MGKKEKQEKAKIRDAKLIKWMQKHDTILVIMMLTILVSAFCFNIELDSNDELWNFSNIYKMANGSRIYQDCNVIITPLFFYVGLALFKLLGSNYLIFRLYNFLIFTGLHLAIYQVLKCLKVQKINAFLYTIILYLLSFNLIPTGANYNVFVLIFVLIGIIAIVKIKNQKQSDIIQGIILFLIIMTKQNVGVFYLLGLLLYEILSKKNIKQIVQISIRQWITTGILGLFFLGYLYSQGLLYPFINYAILGMQEFAENNMTLRNTNSIMMLLQIAIFIFLMVICFHKKIREKIEENVRDNILLLASIGIMMGFISLPILNTYHQILANITIFIAFFYSFDSMINEIINTKQVTKIKIAVLILIIAGFCFIHFLYTYSMVIYHKNGDTYSYQSPYYGAIVPKERKEEIKKICEYIQETREKGIEIRILSHKASLYYNILQLNYGDMDLPFVGNMGKDGEDGMIRKIENLKEAYILITKEPDNLYQESKKVRSYIENNLKKIGEIGEFFIFQND